MLRNVIILVMSAAVSWLSSSCRSHPASAMISDICRQPDRSSVQTIGYVRLPIAEDGVLRKTDSDREQLLIIAENENGTGTFVNAVVSTTDGLEPNRMRSLPLSYTYADLHIITDSGVEASMKDPLKITGRIAKDPRPCILTIEKIETP